MRACILPSYPILTFPGDLWQAFLLQAGGNLIGRSTGINLWGMDFESAGVYVYLHQSAPSCDNYLLTCQVGMAAT